MFIFTSPRRARLHCTLHADQLRDELERDFVDFAAAAPELASRTPCNEHPLIDEAGPRAGKRRGRSEPSGTTVADLLWVLFVGLLYRKWPVMTSAATLGNIAFGYLSLTARSCVLYAVTPLVSHGHLGFFFSHSSGSPFPRHSAPRSLSLYGSHERRFRRPSLALRHHCFATWFHGVRGRSAGKLRQKPFASGRRLSARN